MNFSKLLKATFGVFVFIVCLLFFHNPIAYAKSNQNYEYKITKEKVTITRYIGDEDHVIIPSKIDNLPVTTIASYAFESSSVKTVYIPKSVTRLEDSVFWECNNLTGVIIGSGVTKISDTLFFDCKNLQYIVFGKNIKKIYDPFSAGSDHKLKYVSVLADDISLGSYGWFYGDDTTYTVSTLPQSKSEKKFKDNDIPVKIKGNVKVTFVNGDKTILTIPILNPKTVLTNLFGLSDTSSKQFIGWYTKSGERIDKVGNQDITVYSKFVNKPDKPVVKVKKTSNGEYTISWNKQSGYYYQIEYKAATYRGSKYKVLQKYTKNIGSYKASVNQYYDAFFRVKAYKLVDGVKVYSEYSKDSYSSKPVYPAIYISEYSLDMNYADGVDNTIWYYNNSSKEIKYIYFTVTPYNAVKDKITDEIFRKSSFRLKDVGPISSNKKGGGTWEAVWYNGSTSYGVITKAEIIYMDGSKKEIKINKKSKVL